MEAGFRLRDSIRRVDIWREFRVELLLPCIEKSQQTWFEHLTRTHPGCLPLEVFRYMHLGDLVVDPEQRDFISHLSLEPFRIPREELDNVAVRRDTWNTLLSLLPP